MCRFVTLLPVVVMHLGLGGPWTTAVTAQVSTPASLPAAIPPFLVDWAEAWSSGDLERVLAFYTEDAVYEEIPTGIVSRGREEFRDYAVNTFRVFPGVQVIPRSGFQAETWAVLLADFAGTSAEGASFSIRFVAVFELEGNKIVRQTDYFDLRSLLTQLEAAGGAPATPVP